MLPQYVENAGVRVSTVIILLVSCVLIDAALPPQMLGGYVLQTTYNNTQGQTMGVIVKVDFYLQVILIACIEGMQKILVNGIFSVT